MLKYITSASRITTINRVPGKRLANFSDFNLVLTFVPRSGNKLLTLRQVTGLPSVKRAGQSI